MGTRRKKGESEEGGGKWEMGRRIERGWRHDRRVGGLARETEEWKEGGGKTREWEEGGEKTGEWEGREGRQESGRRAEGRQESRRVGETILKNSGREERGEREVDNS